MVKIAKGIVKAAPKAEAKKVVKKERKLEAHIAVVEAIGKRGPYNKIVVSFKDANNAEAKEWTTTFFPWHKDLWKEILADKNFAALFNKL